MGDMDWARSNSSPFHLGTWIGPFAVRHMDPFPVGHLDRLLSNWRYDRPLCSWGNGLAPFQMRIWIGPFCLGIWTDPFVAEDMALPLYSRGYGLAHFRLEM